MIVPVSAVYAAVITLMVLALAFRVSSFRLRDRVNLGDQGSRDLRVAVRSHANLVEYAPLFVLLLFIGELNGVPVGWLHGAGLLFVLSRFAHAWGMEARSGGSHPSRLVGIGGTWLSIGIMVALLIWNLTQFRL